VSREIFDDLFAATFPHPKVDDIPRIARIERALNENYDATESLLEQIVAAESQTDKAQGSRELAAVRSNRFAQPWLPTASPKEEAEHARGEIEAEIATAGKALGNLLRARTGSDPLLLDRIWLWNTDLHDANLRNINFEDCWLTHVDVSGADLRGTKLFGGMNTVKWWLARYLDKDVIEAAMKNDYPYAFNSNGGNSDQSVSYDEPPVTRTEYVKNIGRLCKQVGCDAADSKVLFGPPTPASVK
jgi:hypothetical protein